MARRSTKSKKISDEEFYETFPPGQQPQNGARFDLQKLRIDYKVIPIQPYLVSMLGENI